MAGDENVRRGLRMSLGLPVSAGSPSEYPEDGEAAPQMCPVAAPRLAEAPRRPRADEGRSMGNTSTRTKRRSVRRVSSLSHHCLGDDTTNKTPKPCAVCASHCANQV